MREGYDKITAHFAACKEINPICMHHWRLAMMSSLLITDNEDKIKKTFQILLEIDKHLPVFKRKRAISEELTKLIKELKIYETKKKVLVKDLIALKFD